MTAASAAPLCVAATVGRTSPGGVVHAPTFLSLHSRHQRKPTFRLTLFCMTVVFPLTCESQPKHITPVLCFSCFSYIQPSAVKNEHRLNREKCPLTPLDFWSPIATHLVIDVGAFSSKRPKPPSFRIGMKFDRIALQLKYALTNGVGFSIWRHTFKISAMKLFHAEKCCHLLSAHRASARHPLLQHLSIVRWLKPWSPGVTAKDRSYWRRLADNRSDARNRIRLNGPRHGDYHDDDDGC